MAALGFWAPFINEPEMMRWYALPAELAEEAARFRPNGREMNPLSAHDYHVLHRETVSYVRRSVVRFAPAYHNDGMHFARTEALGLAAADAYANGRKRRLLPLVRQSFGLALRGHDAHHCASTFRIEAPRGIHRRDLGMNVSTEWVTALEINDFMRRQGLNLPTRLFQTSVIWSSTFGGHTPTGRQLGIPIPQPTTIWGAIMRAADTCPPVRFSCWLQHSTAVNYGEVPATPVSHTLDGFITSSVGFVAYAEACFTHLDNVSGMRLTAMLGWRDRLVSLRNGIQALRLHDKRAIALLQRAAGRYGVSLG